MKKLFRTSSGKYYVYNAITNEILTVSKGFVKNTEQETQQLVMAYLEKHDYCSENAFRKVIWRYPYEQYLNMLEGQLSTLLLQLTCRCNLNCSYCVYSGKYTHMKPHENADMTWETARKSIDFFIAHNSEYESATIDFYGGEPLLRFEMMKQIVEYVSMKLSEKSLLFRFTTNGFLLTETVVKWMHENPQVKATVTINGPYHDTYRKTVSGIGSLDTIMENVRLIRNDYPCVWDNQIRFISNAINVGQVKPICQFYCNRIGRPPLTITHIREQDGNAEITEMLRYEDEEELNRIREEYCQTRDIYLGSYFESGISSVKNRTVYRGNMPGVIGSCLPFLNKLYVYYDGRFGICETTCDKIITGDINRGYDYAILKQIYDNCEKLYNRHCANCWAQRLCTICFKDIISANGKLNDEIDDSFCSSSKRYILDQLIMFCEMYGK